MSKNRVKVSLNNEFLTEIIDSFEEFLEEKGVQIPNEDRDRDDPDNGTIIYGMDFADLLERTRAVCNSFGLQVDDDWDTGEQDDLEGDYVWAIDYGKYGGVIHTNLFEDKEAAEAVYDDLPDNWYKNMYLTKDIWGWKERQRKHEGR